MLRHTHKNKVSHRQNYSQTDIKKQNLQNTYTLPHTHAHFHAQLHTGRHEQLETPTHRGIDIDRFMLTSKDRSTEKQTNTNTQRNKDKYMYKPYTTSHRQTQVNTCTEKHTQEYIHRKSTYTERHWHKTNLSSVP